jgi:ribonuclease P protein component
MILQTYTFDKKERLCKKSILDQLIASKDNPKIKEFPFLCIWTECKLDVAYPAQVLISVGKRNIRKAVLRNKIKRQIREVYRHQKHKLYKHLKSNDKQIALAIFYIGKEILPQKKLEVALEKSITHIIHNC